MDPLAFSSPPHTAGPAFASSRVLRLSDLSADEQDSFIKFFAEQKLAVSRRRYGARRRPRP